MKYVVCLHLYIPWKFGERGSTPRGTTGPSLSFCFFVCFFCLFVCPSRYDARHRKPRRFVYALNLGGTGISPPNKSTPGQKIPPAPDTQQAATYSIAAVAGNWTILVIVVIVCPMQCVAWDRIQNHLRRESVCVWVCAHGVRGRISRKRLEIETCL